MQSFCISSMYSFDMPLVYCSSPAHSRREKSQLMLVYQQCNTRCACYFINRRVFVIKNNCSDLGVIVRLDKHGRRRLNAETLDYLAIFPLQGKFKLEQGKSRPSRKQTSLAKYFAEAFCFLDGFFINPSEMRCHWRAIRKLMSLSCKTN